MALNNLDRDCESMEAQAQGLVAMMIVMLVVVLGALIWVVSGGVS